MDADRRFGRGQWDSLPAELFPIIFEYVPRRPRLRCVSLVCKRWRIAILRSVEVVTLANVRNAESILELLPSLTDLTVRHSRLPAQLNSTITILRVDGTDRDAVEVDDRLYTAPQVLQLPALRSLTYVGFEAAMLRVLGIAARSVTTLTSLRVDRLTGSGDPIPPLSLDFLESLQRFPALSDFAFDVQDVREVETLPQAMLRAYASQLTSLDLASYPSQIALTLQFPRLTSLHYWRAPQRWDRRLGELLPRCPVLSSLTAETPLSIDEPHLRPWLSSLRVLDIMPSEWPDLSLDCTSTLREIHVHGYTKLAFFVSLQLANLAHLVSKLQLFVEPDSDLAFMHHYTNITELRLVGYAPRLPLLPKLQRASIGLGIPPFTRASPVFSDIITHTAPFGLQQLMLIMVIPSNDEELAALESLLRAARERLVQNLVLAPRSMTIPVREMVPKYSDAWTRITLKVV